MSSSTGQLGSFGWNWSFLGDIQLQTDSTGNVTILNSRSFLPQQRPGTALYENNLQGLPPEQLVSNPYNINTQQLVAIGLGQERQFNLQSDGSYQGQDKDKGILTLVGGVYRLKEKDGTVIVFRADGHLDYVEDPNGYKMSAGYTNNQLTSLSASNGDSFTLSYNASGRVSAIADQTGQTISYKYDSSGQLLSSIEDSRGKTSFTYGHPYNPMALTSVTYADGLKVTYDYDEYGRTQQVIVGEGRQALAYTYKYDPTGGYTFTDPSGATTKVVSNDDNSLTVTDPLGQVFQYKYDASGMLNTVTGPDGFQVDYNFCGCGQLRSFIDPLGNKTTFKPEPNFGKLQSVTDARGNDLIYGYAPRGRGTWNYTYDLAGQLTHAVFTSTNSSIANQELSYVYDAVGDRIQTI